MRISVPNLRQQLLDLCLLRCAERLQQRRTGAPAKVAVKVAGVFDSADAELRDDAATRAGRSVSACPGPAPCRDPSRRNKPPGRTAERRRQSPGRLPQRRLRGIRASSLPSRSAPESPLRGVRVLTGATGGATATAMPLPSAPAGTNPPSLLNLRLEHPSRHRLKNSRHRNGAARRGTAWPR